MKDYKVANPSIALIIHSHDLNNLHHVIIPYLKNIEYPFDVYLNFSEIVGSTGEKIKQYKKEMIEADPNISFFSQHPRIEEQIMVVLWHQPSRLNKLE